MPGSAFDSMLGAGRKVWRGLLPPGVRRLAGPLVLAYAERRAMAGLVHREPDIAAGPLVVAGLISETKGVSEAARLTVMGLEAAGLDVTALDLRPILAAGPSGQAGLGVDAPGGAIVLHVNAPEAVSAFAALDPATWRGRRRIGYWAYELPAVPPLWTRAAMLFHEIWVPSVFVRDALLASRVTTPIRVMPHPVGLRGAPPAPDRARFGIAEGEFAVLAMGDLSSSATRKNLAGAIAIYREAFPEPGVARLIVKTQATGGQMSRRAFEAVAAGRSDISFITETLPGNDLSRLIASVDVVLSPHRAEGYGLVLAEALLAGVPALATGWSGNLDFMAGLDDLLIRCSLTPVSDPDGVYGGRGLLWAEPDVPDAVAKLRHLHAGPALRRSLAGKGHDAILAQLGAWDRRVLLEGPFAGVLQAAATAPRG